MKEADILYKQYIKDLSEEAIPKTTNVVALPDNKISDVNIKVKETNKTKVDDEIHVSKKKVSKNKIKIISKSNVI